MSFDDNPRAAGGAEPAIEDPHTGVPPAVQEMEAAAPTGVLARIAEVSRRHRWRTIAVWLAALAAVAVASGVAAGDFDADYTAAGSDSRAARDLLDTRFPAAAAETITVGRARRHRHHRHRRPGTGRPAAATTRREAARAGGRLPLRHPGGGLGRPAHRPCPDPPRRRPSSAMPADDTQSIMDTAVDASTDTIGFSLNGQVVADVQNGNGGPEVIGLAAAVLILLLTFGSVIAAGLPVGVAVAGLAISSSLIALLTHLMSVPPRAPALAAMLGIGFGIDYVLLMVTRYRENLTAGLTPRQAILATVDTAGRSVIIAGSTVIVSLLGLIAAKAALLNLLSIGAAYGIIALVLQGGWAGHLVGIDTATPLPAYIPVLVFAILFGLSMDYEVFLLGRMHEH